MNVSTVTIHSPITEIRRAWRGLSAKHWRTICTERDPMKLEGALYSFDVLLDLTGQYAQDFTPERPQEALEILERAEKATGFSVLRRIRPNAYPAILTR